MQLSKCGAVEKRGITHTCGIVVAYGAVEAVVGVLSWDCYKNCWRG